MSDETCAAVWVFVSASLAKNTTTALVRASVFGRVLRMFHYSKRPLYGKPGVATCAVMSAI